MAVNSPHDEIASLDDLEVVDVFGLPFVRCPSEADFTDLLIDFAPSEARPKLLVTPNVDIVVQLAKTASDQLRSDIDAAEFILPDGAPIVAAANAAGHPRMHRLAGSTIFANLWPRLAATERPTTVLATSDEVSVRLQKDLPVGEFAVAPMLGEDDGPYEQCAADLIERAVRNRSAFIIIGLAFPKDVRIARFIIDRWPAATPAPMILCFGAGPEMYLGLRRRAPVWMQRCGMEWFYRFAQEPRRLFTRYFVRDAAFLPMAARAIRDGRRSNKPDERVSR